jgi:hypothetical protein
MTAMPPLQDILIDTPANAEPVQQNFETIETHISNELINRDGSVGMTGPLSLPGEPVSNNQAANKGYVDAQVPTGAMWDFLGVAATLVSLGLDSVWGVCDGSSQSGTDPKYARLYGLYGPSGLNVLADAGGGNFYMPDLRGRATVGRNSAVTAFDTVGKTLGDGDQVAQHSHPMPHTHPMTHTHTMAHTHNMAHIHAIDPPSTALTYPSTGGNGLFGWPTSGNGNRPLNASDQSFHAGQAVQAANRDVKPTVNISSFNSGGASTSNTGGSSESKTGGASSSNTGDVSTPNTSNAGQATNGNYFPVYVCTKIVRL